MSKNKDKIRELEGIQSRLLIENDFDAIRNKLKEISISNRGLLITGARGVGKTTWMLSQLKENASNFLYFSADNPLISEYSLYDLVDAIFMDGYDGVFIDEVHYAQDWSIHLKALYDAFPRKTIVASDSNSIALASGLADLSRRFLIQKIPLLSFREYLMLKTKLDFPQIDPYKYDLKEVAAMMKKVNVLRLFKNYLKTGLRPFFVESEEHYSAKLMNTIKKSMESDIPFIVPSISDNHLRLMNSVVGYLAVSKVPVLQVNSLCRQWGVGKEKLYQLLEAMERAHIIRSIRKRNDTKIHSAGAKLFLHDTSVYNCFPSPLGTMREAYVANISIDSGRAVFASKNEKDCDFLIDSLKIEVGGRKKAAKSADFVIRDDIDVPSGNVIPLWLLGLEY